MDLLESRVRGKPRQVCLTTEGLAAWQRIGEGIRKQKETVRRQAELADAFVRCSHDDRIGNIDDVNEFIQLSYPRLSASNCRLIANLVTGLSEMEMLQALTDIMMPVVADLATVSSRYHLSLPSEIIQESQSPPLL